MSNRIATRVLEDAGDVIRDVNLVDVNASETLVAAEHANVSTVPWAPAVWPTGGPVILHRFHVKSKSSQAGGHIVSHQLETMLGRLTRAYPASVMATAAAINAELGASPWPDVTLAAALEYALRRWKTEFPWLDWMTPLPNLGVQTSAGFVVPRVTAVAFRQGENPRSLRQWIDETLRLFTGYVLRVNSDGKLLLVAPPQSHEVTLTDDQIYSLLPSTPLDDIINRATVRSRQWAFEAAEYTEAFTTSLTADQSNVHEYVDGSGNRSGYRHLITQVEGETSGWHDIELNKEVMAGLTGAVYADVRVEAITRTFDGDTSSWENTSGRINAGQFQEIIAADTADPGSTSIDVAPLEFALAGNTTITFTNGVEARVTIPGPAKGATTLNLAVPLDGAVPRGMVALHSMVDLLTNVSNQTLVSASQSGGPSYRLGVGPHPTDPLKWRVGWTVAGPISRVSDPLEDEDYYFGLRVVVRLYAYNYQQTNNEVTATFGRVDTDDATKQPGIVDSQTDYGVVERTLDAGFANLDPLDAMAIAEAYVAANMNPRERVTLEITPDLPIRPEHINRMARLPDGSDVIVESWEHTEVFDNTSASVTTRVTAVRSET